MAWTELTQRPHARVGDKYASDLTDAEWALIEPLMPPLKTTGRPRRTRLRDVSTRFSTSRRPGANGACCPTTFHRFLQFGALSTRGAMKACWSRSTASWSVEAARLTEGRKAQPRAPVTSSGGGLAIRCAKLPCRRGIAMIPSNPPRYLGFRP